MSTSGKKIVICEDHQIVIDGLRSIFENQNKYSIIDYVSNANDLFKSIEKNNPDIILLDLNLPGKNGLEILKDIRKYNKQTKILILTMYNTDSIIKEVVRNGANGFLLKNCSTEDLIEALKHIYNSNQFYLGKGVKRISKKEIFEREDNFYKRIKITKREKEIIFELVKGVNVPEIAKKLFISPYTVETHKKNIFRKLDIHSSIDLLKFTNEREFDLKTTQFFVDYRY